MCVILFWLRRPDIKRQVPSTPPPKELENYLSSTVYYYSLLIILTETKWGLFWPILILSENLCVISRDLLFIWGRNEGESGGELLAGRGQGVQVQEACQEANTGIQVRSD